MTDSFEASWMFPNELKKDLGASGYDVNPTMDTFSTGRAKFEAVFFEGEGHNRKVVERRTAMELTSRKTGKPYHVVRRKAANHEGRPAAQQAAPAARQEYSLDDALAA